MTTSYQGGVCYSNLNFDNVLELKEVPFSSDVFSLGMVLFEVLVENLTKGELGQFRSEVAYDEQHEQNWHRGLIEKIQTAQAEGRLNRTEAGLIRGMLAFNVSRRDVNLGRAIKISRGLAFGWTPVQQELNKIEQLKLATTLLPDKPESIARFISEYLGVPREQIGETSEEIGAFIENELRGAKVYRNANNSVRPLILEGRLIQFSVGPFQMDDQIYSIR